MDFSRPIADTQKAAVICTHYGANAVARNSICMYLLTGIAQDYTKAIDIWRSRPVSELLGLHCCGDDLDDLGSCAFVHLDTSKFACV